MTKILSQDEVDSLLKGIDEGKLGGQGEVAEENLNLPPYDFRKEHGPVHQRMPGIGAIMERFTGLLAATLSAVSGSQVDVNPSEMTSVAFSDFCRSVPLPASFNLFKMEPLRGASMIALDGSLVFALIGLYLGGRGEKQVKPEGRSFTPIELRIIEKIVKGMLDGLVQAWSDVQKLHAVFLRCEIDPQFAEIARPDDVVLVSKFIVEIGNFSGGMMICVPFAVLEPLREKLRGGFHSENLGVDERWRKYLEKKMGELKVNVSCTLGHSRMAGREVLRMKVNDVIPLEQRPDDSVVICVEGIPKFKGHLGAFRRNKAIRIDERLNRE